MRHYDATIGDTRRDVTKPVGNVLVRKAMKAIASNTFRIEIQRNRIMVGERIVTAMERGIETSDLREVRVSHQQRPDRRQIIGLMQRRK